MPKHAWVSKHALTSGIHEVEVDRIVDGKYLEVKNATRPVISFYRKSEWHRTREEAVKKADVMRRRRIHSLEGTIAQLERMKF